MIQAALSLNQTFELNFNDDTLISLQVQAGGYRLGRSFEEDLAIKREPFGLIRWESMEKRRDYRRISSRSAGYDLIDDVVYTRWRERLKRGDNFSLETTVQMRSFRRRNVVRLKFSAAEEYSRINCTRRERKREEIFVAERPREGDTSPWKTVRTNRA